MELVLSGYVYYIFTLYLNCCLCGNIWRSNVLSTRVFPCFEIPICISRSESPNHLMFWMSCFNLCTVDHLLYWMVYHLLKTRTKFYCNSIFFYLNIGSSDYEQILKNDLFNPSNLVGKIGTADARGMLGALWYCLCRSCRTYTLRR